LNRNRRSQIGFYPDDIKKLPVKITSRENQLLVKKLTLCIMNSSGEENIDAFSFFDKLINSAIYEVYFPEVFGDADIEILKYVADFPSFNDTATAEGKTEQAVKLYNQISQSSHVIMKMMEKVKELNEVKIIEGRV
jgi:hypothetical protein